MIEHTLVKAEALILDAIVIYPIMTIVLLPFVLFLFLAEKPEVLL